jgi:putative FmdB family regulatory protein
MPTYEYKCTECGHCFDVVHKVDENVEICESCGSRVRRLFHPVGVIFKGSGFYSTDNRSSGSNGGKPASTGDAGGGDKKEEGPKPSDSAKPAAKSEPSQKTEKAGESESA